ncbi:MULTISPECIES: hypothetical protein [unclassified Massilia]|uniref:hypothetical protein n=1 Tax=unclassified Massilia TaxID=2609279 RepID=UPI0012E3DFFA|nr:MULTISPECIES: hypothetical protein [unclassified Massilia]
MGVVAPPTFSGCDAQRPAAASKRTRLRVVSSMRRCDALTENRAPAAHSRSYAASMTARCRSRRRRRNVATEQTDGRIAARIAVAAVVRVAAGGIEFRLQYAAALERTHSSAARIEQVGVAVFHEGVVADDDAGRGVVAARINSNDTQFLLPSSSNYEFQQ